MNMSVRIIVDRRYFAKAGLCHYCREPIPQGKYVSKTYGGAHRNNHHYHTSHYHIACSIQINLITQEDVDALDCPELIMKKAEITSTP